MSISKKNHPLGQFLLNTSLVLQGAQDGTLLELVLEGYIHDVHNVHITLVVYFCTSPVHHFTLVNIDIITIVGKLSLLLYILLRPNRYIFSWFF